MESRLSRVLIRGLALVLAAIPILAGAGRVAAGLQPSPSDLPSLRAFFVDAMREARVRGASVALIRQRRVVWMESFGVRDERTRQPVRNDTIFQAASIGKVLAAYGALLRVQDGDWRLDMPVSSGRLDLPDGCRAPTLVELLSHTAGLGNDLLAERFAGVCQLPAPFSYAGQGYLVLQDLFGDAAGEAAERFLQERVFGPLHMERATFVPNDDAQLATGHADLLYGVVAGKASWEWRAFALLVLGLLTVLFVWLGRRAWHSRAHGRALARFGLGTLAALLIVLFTAATTLVPVEPWSTRSMLPSSLRASIDDLARFALELLEPRLSRPETLHLLLEPRVQIDDELAWAAGIGIDRIPVPGHDEPVVSYWQWGSNPGFQGLLVLVPERGDALVVLTNTGGFADVVLGGTGGYAMAKRVARRALGLDGRWDLWRAAPAAGDEAR